MVFCFVTCQRVLQARVRVRAQPQQIQYTALQQPASQWARAAAAQLSRSFGG